MQELIERVIVDQIYVFILVFVRVGAAFMVMPGIGDSFVSARIRLFFALSMSVLMTPLLSQYIPDVRSASNAFVVLVVMEAVIGIFIGTIARILIAALDVAGMIISTQIGLASAQVFNPGFAAQGSIIGAFLSITGVVFIFATDLHHLLIRAVVDSYLTFPPGRELPGEGMAEMVAMTVSQSFKVGFQLAVPFVITGLMVYLCMGVLARVMPQIQVFILALPMQIMMGLLTLSIVFSTLMMYWIGYFEEGMFFFLGDSGKSIENQNFGSGGQ